MFKLFPAIFLAFVMVLSERKRWGNSTGWQCKCHMYCFTVYCLTQAVCWILNLHRYALVLVWKDAGMYVAAFLPDQNLTFPCLFHCFSRIRLYNYCTWLGLFLQHEDHTVSVLTCCSVVAAAVGVDQLFIPQGSTRFSNKLSADLWLLYIPSATASGVLDSGLPYYQWSCFPFCGN